MTYTKESTIQQVIQDPVFYNFGHLLFPIDLNIPFSTKLKDLDQYFIWYHYMNADKTVEIVNYLHGQAKKGRQIFYPVNANKNVGLFYFQGKENGKCAVLNAGGGFMYCGAMHDSFPHALELSKQGYNAFALIYRPNQAMQDLSQAIAFLFEHETELKIDMHHYSVWGGSAGARMAAWLGNEGTYPFIRKQYPTPTAVIMQYTGMSSVTGQEPPTYNCVGTNDWIADYTTMLHRIQCIQRNGTDAQIDIYQGLSHGFGLGIGTNAEGWINHAIAFWKRNIEQL